MHLRFFKLKKSDRFQPDVCLEDGDDLREYGFDAQVLHLPGHSNGSIGVLTAGGDLFCGDLLRNWGKPAPGFGIFDLVGFKAITSSKTQAFNNNRCLPQAWQAIPDGTVHKKSPMT